MGIFSSMFNKMGHWHIKQLVKEGADNIMNASMQDYQQKDNPYLIDLALDLLIDHGSFKIMKAKSYSELKDKFKDYMSFYVVRNLGRDMDHLSGDHEAMVNEIEKYWPVFKTTKDGVDQTLRS